MHEYLELNHMKEVKDCRMEYSTAVLSTSSLRSKDDERYY